MKLQSFKHHDGLNWYRLIFGFLGNLFLIYCVAVGLMLIVFSSLTIECSVVGASMVPTYNADSKKTNDTVFVNRFDKSCDYGDIIVINIDGREDPIIKRVVARAGDIVDIVEDEDGLFKLEVNNKIVEESYLNLIYDENLLEYEGDYNGMLFVKKKLEKLAVVRSDLFIESGENAGKILVPEDCVFAMGDNRHNSQDSTYYGAFSIEKILGVVERSLFAGESEFGFYFDYIVKGQVFETIGKCN